jgi:hypothetical protein
MNSSNLKKEKIAHRTDPASIAHYMCQYVQYVPHASSDKLFREWVFPPKREVRMLSSDILKNATDTWTSSQCITIDNSSSRFLHRSGQGITTWPILYHSHLTDTHCTQTVFARTTRAEQKILVLIDNVGIHSKFTTGEYT